MDTYKIGRFMAECRKQKGMTQAQLAEKLGVTAKTISRWENGNYMPDLSLLIPISETLEITLNELLNGERIPQEEAGEKAEASISGALQYSAEQLKKNRKRMAWLAAFFVGFFILVMAVLNYIYFTEIPYHKGDVSKWEELFPNHSAYELAISDNEKPVFTDTKRALEQIKTDCSDAIEEIQEEYRLLPLTKYTYRLYAGYLTQLDSADERVLEQQVQLQNFLDIYENSYEWKNILYNGVQRKAEGGFSMSEMYKNAVIVALVLGVFALVCLIFAIDDMQKARKPKKLDGQAKGVITGLVRSSLFKNHVQGDVPGGVLIGWGVAQGEQFWGGTPKMRIPPWFPCVKFTVDGKEFIKITGEGVTRDVWKIGQEVTVLYDSKNPYVSNIEGDPSPWMKMKLDFALTGIFAAACAVAVLFLVLV